MMVSGIVVAAIVGGSSTVYAQQQPTDTPRVFADSDDTCSTNSGGVVQFRSSADATMVIEYRNAGVWTEILRREAGNNEIVSTPDVWTAYARGGRSAFRATSTSAQRPISAVAACGVNVGEAEFPGRVAAPKIVASVAGVCQPQQDGRVVVTATVASTLYLSVRIEGIWKVVATLNASEAESTAFPGAWRDYVQVSGQSDMRVVSYVSGLWSPAASCSISV